MKSTYPREKGIAAEFENSMNRKKQSMPQVLRSKLKKLRRRRTCPIDGQQQGGTNPLARCHECHQRFCFDHIQSGQIKNGMQFSEVVRDICEVCADLHGYSYMGEVIYENRNGYVLIV